MENLEELINECADEIFERELQKAEKADEAKVEKLCISEETCIKEEYEHARRTSQELD